MPLLSKSRTASLFAKQDEWLDELAEMASRPPKASPYLDDTALRRIRATADASYRRADRELQARFPQFYPGREHRARG
jgi:hypothetical protein